MLLYDLCSPLFVTVLMTWFVMGAIDDGGALRVVVLIVGGVAWCASVAGFAGAWRAGKYRRVEGEPDES